MTIIKFSTLSILLINVFWGVNAEYSENLNMVLQIYSGNRSWEDTNLTPVSVVLDIKNNLQGKEAFLTIPLPFKYIKTIDEPKPFTSLPEIILPTHQGKWVCNSNFNAIHPVSASDSPESGFDDEEEEESCSAEEIATNLKKLSAIEKSRMSIKLKEDLEVPIEEDKLKLFFQNQFIKINLPKEQSIIKNGKYVWNILLSFDDSKIESYDDLRYSNWRFVIVTDGEMVIPKYKIETSPTGYRYLSQALKKNKMKIISEITIPLEKTQMLNTDLVRKLPSTISTTDKDINIKFKTPNQQFKFKDVIFRLVYHKEDATICKRLELTTLTEKVTIGKCEYSNICKGEVKLSNFDKKLIPNTEYSLIIKNTQILAGEKLEITMIENDEYGGLKQIIKNVTEPCKTLFEFSYIKSNPIIISYSLLSIHYKQIYAKLHLHSETLNSPYFYGILDLPKLDLNEGFKVILETTSELNKSNLKFISSIDSNSALEPILPNNYSLDITNNKLTITVANNDPKEYTSIPLLIKYKATNEQCNLKMTIISNKDSAVINGNVEIINGADNNYIDIHGPRFMGKNTIIYTLNNVKPGDYFVQFESSNNLIDKCGQINISHESFIKTECSAKLLKFNLSLPNEQQRIDIKIDVKQFRANDDITFTLGIGTKKYMSYKINLNELFVNTTLDESICIISQNSSIIDSTLTSSFQMVKCSTPWIPSNYKKHNPNLYLLNHKNELIKDDYHILRYKNDPLSDQVIPSLMPVTLYLLADTDDLKIDGILCKTVICKTVKLQDNIEDQITQLYAQNINNEKISVAIITKSKITNKVKKSIEKDQSAKQLFIPTYIIDSNIPKVTSLQYKTVSPSYFDPRRVAPLLLHNPIQINNVISTKIGDNSIHFGIVNAENTKSALVAIEEIMSDIVIPSWINYLSCVNSGNISVNYMDKTLFKVAGNYNKKFCSHLSLLFNLQIENA